MLWRPGLGLEDGGDQEPALAAVWASEDVAAREPEHDGFGGLLGARFGRGLIQEFSTSGELLAPLAVGEQSVMSDAHEARRQAMQQEASDELGCLQALGLELGGIAIIAPAEQDAAVLDGGDAIVGDGDAVRVAAEIGDDLFGPGAGRF